MLEKLGVALERYDFSLERYGFWLLLLAVVLGLLSFVWLLVVAFRQRTLWGVVLLVFPPAALVFVIKYFRRSTGPLLLLLVAVVIGAVPFGVAYYERHFVPPRPYEQLVDGEVRTTLTGVKGFDYSTLKDRPETVVLQMANDDVDDNTLEHLRGMYRLRKLDLSDTRVTDKGLEVLAELPRLQELYLARTKISDEGFQKHLALKVSLLKLDLTGTDVKGKTKREWKKARPEREYVD